MFKKTVIAAGLGLAISSAAQAEYQFEIGAISGTGDIEIANVKADQDFIGLSGAYYLQPVDTTKGPLSEAAFLDRSSSIQFAATTGEIDIDGGDDADVDTYLVSSRLVQKESGWLIDLGYQLDKIDGSGFDDEDIDTYTIGAGKYILENTAVILSYSNIDSDDAYQLDLEHMWLLEQGGIKLDAEVGRVVDAGFQSDDLDFWGLSSTYYVNDRLGFGADYGQEESGASELDSWSLFAEWFVTEQVALSLAYAEQEDNDIDFESDAVMFTADVRF